MWKLFNGPEQRSAEQALVSPEKPLRDYRLDLLRGLMLIIIFINHMPGHVLAHYTPSHFSFSDAAEIFVLLAGVSSTLAYGRQIDQQGLTLPLIRIVARLWTLYVAHLVVFLVVCGVVFVAVTRTQNPLYIEIINIQPFINNPIDALVDVLMLVYQPNYLNILPLYIVLLSAFPIIYVCMRLSPFFTLLASVLLWKSADFFGINLPDRFGGHWFFNPFAWQLVFSLGIFIGHCMQLKLALIRSKIITGIAILVLVSLSAAKSLPSGFFELPWLDSLIDELHISNNKMNFASVRLLHLLSIIWVFCYFTSARSAFLTTLLSKGLIIIGRQALAVFCVGTVLSMLGLVIITEYSYSLTIQLLVCVIGILLLFGLGVFLSWYQSQIGRATSATAHSSISTLAPRY